MIRYNEDNNKQMKELKWNTNQMNQWTVNEIGDEGAIAISESLKTNTTLTSLNLQGDDKIQKRKQWINEWWNEMQIQ